MGAENLQEVRIMKPQFANVFNVSVNDNRSECSLSFYHTVSYTHLTLPTT